MKPKTYYRLQYCDGTLSAVVRDDKGTMKRFAEVVAKNKHHYPVAIWKITIKEEA